MAVLVWGLSVLNDEDHRQGHVHTRRGVQHALADFLARGELDRHLRRMRRRYRRRRDLLVQELTASVPDGVIGGIAAGLHLTLQLRETDNGRGTGTAIPTSRTWSSTVSLGGCVPLVVTSGGPSSGPVRRRWPGRPMTGFGRGIRPVAYKEPRGHEHAVIGDIDLVAHR